MVSKSKFSFWFVVPILFWIGIILVSLALAYLTKGFLATRVAEYGSILYIGLTAILALLFRRKHRDWSRDIIKAFIVVFLAWLGFIIIFGLSFFIGFKYF